MGTGSERDPIMQSDDVEIDPKIKPKYTLEELLAQSDCSTPSTKEDREWIDAPRAGRELI
jgi:antitoxin ChpS